MKYDVILIDGNNLAHRNYHSNKDLASTIGNHRYKTGVPFGCINSIIGLSNYFEPGAKKILVWDKGYDRRLLLHPGYKQSRRDREWEDRDDFLKQRRLFRRILPLLGIWQAYKQGEEADDVIGTLANQNAKLGHRVLIITGDHDMFQLIDKTVHILKPSIKGTKLYDRDKYFKEFGIEPVQVIDIMSLQGDKGDDVPGVNGIGEKIALKLIIDNPYLISRIIRGEDLELKNVTPKLSEKLMENIEAIKLANKLVNIDCYIDKITYVKPNKDLDRIEDAFEILKFRSLLLKDKWETIESW